MNRLKAFVVILSAVFFDFTIGVKLNCELRNNWNYQELFNDLAVVLGPGTRVCGFEDDNNASLNLEVDLEDDKILATALVYTTTRSVPVLTPKLYKNLRYLKTCGFYKVPQINISRDWFKYSENLETLFFYKNEIPTLPSGKFVNLQNLAKLLIKDNVIEEIEDKAFSGLNNLKHLDLGFNKIKSLHPNLFIELNNLEYLYLYKSHLMEVDPGVFRTLRQLNTVIKFLARFKQKVP
jgi:Leucine-rich repeat (LRR) protein